MCYFLEESTNTMLSVLFATEDYYTIKEINNVEESFCRRRLSFCQRKLLFWWQKFRKTYFALAFFFVFLLAQITILPTQIEKSLFYVAIFLPRQKV